MIRLSRNLLPLLSVFLLLCLIGGTNAAEWTVSRSFGQTWVETNGVQQVSLGRGGRIRGDATVHTGVDGKVVLVRGRNSMTVGPNSSVSLTNAIPPGKTTIRQNSGTVVYQVQKRTNPHFTVRTQTIAALVKGTKFKVVENRYISKVWVSEGLVQVFVFATGETADIKPGQSAIFKKGRNSRLTIVGSGSKEPITNTALGSGVAPDLGGVTSTLKSAVSGARGGASGAASSAAGTASGVSSSVGGALDGLL